MLSFFGRAAACGFGTWVIYQLTSRIFSEPLAVMPLTVVFSSALWSVSFAKYAIAGMSSLRREARRAALEEWNGRYYAFGAHQLRLFLIEDVIWIPVADVAAILDPQPDARELRYLGAETGLIPGQKVNGYTEAGLLRLLTTRTASRRATHDMIRFKHWLEKETFPNLRRLPASSL